MPIDNDEKFFAIVLLLKAPRVVTRDDFERACARAFGARPKADEVIVLPPDIGKFVLRQDSYALALIGRDAAYIEDQAGAAEQLRLFQLKQIILQHRAWLSVDLLGAAGRGSDHEQVRAAAKLAAAFLDSDCLGIYCVSTREFNVISEETAAILRGPRPLDAFKYKNPDTIITVDNGDAELEQATAEARRRWPEFTQAFRNKRPMQGFAVKAPLAASRGGQEHTWIEVERFDDQRIWGILANEPRDLPGLKIGDPVSVRLSDMEDWIYQNGNVMAGGFSIAILEKRRQP
jgi:uncharacterized protein YegJ (DUF2314 family)